MKQAVAIRIENHQQEMTGETNRLVSNTSGWLLTKAWGQQILYREECEGLEGVLTVVNIFKGKLVVERRGPYSLKQTFEEGIWHQGLYSTPHGIIPLKLHASKVEIDLTGKGGNINVEYELQIGEAHSSLHRLHLTVSC